MSERIVMVCDNCGKDFDESDPKGRVNPQTQLLYRRDSKIVLGHTGIDLCTPCEQTVTVAEARRLADIRSQR